MTAVDLTDAALAAAARGWPVFPLLPGAKRPRPGLTDWETKATVDPDRIIRWWARHPADNIALATGPAGLVVVDLDRARPGDTPPSDWPEATGGADVLAALARRHGHPVPPTWTVATPSGGHHRYHRAPADVVLRNTAGRIGWKIDTRAAGGYVVAPGSIIRGRRYLVIDRTPPVDLPVWLLNLLQPSTPPAPTRIVSSAPRRRANYAVAALEGEVCRVVTAQPGGRNAALNLAAWNLGRLVAAGLLDRSLVEAALREAGELAGGQSPAGVAATVRSAIDARLRRDIAGPPAALVGQERQGVS